MAGNFQLERYKRNEIELSPLGQISSSSSPSRLPITSTIEARYHHYCLNRFIVSMMRIAAVIIMAFLCHVQAANAFVRTSIRGTLKPSQSISAFCAVPSTLRPIGQIAITADVSHRSRLPTFASAFHLPPTTKLFSSLNTDTEIDPYSESAKENLSSLYSQLDPSIASLINTDVDKAHKSLLKLTEQVLAWNQRLNLVSRKDCNANVVYHRHVLPSVALLPLVCERLKESENGTLNIVDVGTGGGFPGLPLALLLPQFQFTLVDSVQKKLVAVSEMASELDMTNVRLHCGRVEEMYTGEKGRSHYNNYDAVLGRSVTALPRFCAWISDLLKDEGKLIYIIGGDVEDVVEERIESDTPVDILLKREEGTSDKRALIFSASSVEEIAEESGEKYNIVRNGVRKKKSNEKRGQGKKLAKGAWSKRGNDVKKDRGYEGFKRYEF